MLVAGKFQFNFRGSSWHLCLTTNTSPSPTLIVVHAILNKTSGSLGLEREEDPGLGTILEVRIGS